jgi:hypothetical protein
MTISQTHLSFILTPKFRSNNGTLQFQYPTEILDIDFSMPFSQMQILYPGHILATISRLVVGFIWYTLLIFVLCAMFSNAPAP